MNRLLFYLLLIVVVLSPMPLGSNREWSWTLMITLVSGLALAWALVGLIQPSKISRKLSIVPVILFLCVCGWAWLQAQADTPSDWHHPLWGVSAQVLDLPLASESTSDERSEKPVDDASSVVYSSISLAPDDTHTAWLRLLSYGLVFFLSFQFCRDAKRAQTVLGWLAVAGLVYSIYGLMIYWSRSDSFLWFWEMDWRSSVRGTFANRNSFATWVGLCLLCALAGFYQRISIRRNPAYSLPAERDLKVERFVLGIWKPVTLLIITVSALILTHSRGGFLSVLGGGVVLLLAINYRQPIKASRIGAAMLVAIVAVLVSFWLTSSTLLERLDVSNVKIDSRLKAFALTVDGIDDNPVLGFGYGTFADGFRLYRDESLGYFNRTHNTYLENLFELGWPAAMALFICFAWLALVCVKGLRDRQRDWIYPALGLAATTVVALHSLVDFSLQMPATAFTYALIMGAACAQSFSSRRA